jgi:hypothetical protein
MIEEVIRKFLSYSSSFVHRNGEAEEFSSSSFFFLHHLRAFPMVSSSFFLNIRIKIIFLLPDLNTFQNIFT